MKHPFFDALLDGRQRTLLDLAKSIYHWLIDKNYRVNIAVRHIALTDGSWSNFLSRHLSNRYPIVIGSTAKIGTGLKLPHYIGIVIGRNAKIGKDCTIYQQVTLGQNKDLYPEIGNNVVIYAGAKIIGGISIGDNAIIGANSVVTKDVPANTIVAGSPAKIIRYRNPETDANFY